MSLQKKPPVVTIMGHVDHGKTSLLDYIRKTKLVTKEFGEITQAIGAYQVEFKGEKITFIDTPGHAAFTKMRSRGASVADVIILVIAANDGIMPQTRESLKIIKKANVPFIVAINKIDLPEALADKVKAQLAEDRVLVEGYGGKVVAVPISAKTGQGIDQLLEMVLLTAEMENLQADPAGELKAEVIESKADKFCGSVATIIIKNGTLRRNDLISADGITAKVRMIKNEWGKPVGEALPGDPVLALGFRSVPAVGAIVSFGEKEMGGVKTTIPKTRVDAEAEKKKLKIILKTDVTGSLEALLGCLPEDVQIVGQGAGEINDSDVLLAKTLGAEIYTFNLPIRGNVAKLAETENVKVKKFKIIYDLLENLEERILKIMEPTVDQKILGKAEIIATFEMKGERIAGAKVLEGKINKKEPVIVERDSRVIAKAKIVSMKQQKQDVNEVTSGSEFGVVFSGKVDFEKGDMILSTSLEEK